MADALAVKIPGLQADAELDEVALRIARVKVRRDVWEKTDYVPHGNQVLAHKAIDRGARFLMLLAGARSGKTRFDASEAIPELAFYPPPNAAQRLTTIAAPETDLTDKVFKWVWNAVVEKRVLNSAPSAKSERMRYIQMPWGSRIEGKTTDKPESLLGEGQVLVIMDEDARIKRGIWEQYIRRNLLDFGGRVIRTTTPLGPVNNSTRIFNLWKRYAETDRRYYVGRFTTYDNPNIPREWIDETLAELEELGLGALGRQEYLGEITVLSGAVYPNFNPEFHVGEFALLPDVPVDLFVDWGFENPFACLFEQVTDDDQFRQSDEIYRSGLTDGQKVELVLETFEEIKRREGLPNLELGRLYADPSSPEAIAEFRQAGIPTFDPPPTKRGREQLKRINAVNDGIAVVRKQFGRKDKPGIWIHRRCKKTIEELQGYKYNDKATGDERPVKENDHTADAKRYGVVGKFIGRSRPVFWRLDQVEDQVPDRDDEDGEE